MTTVRGMRMALTSTLLPQNPAFTWLSRLFDFRNAGDRGFKPRANTTLLMVSSAAARTPVVDEARSARFNQLMLPQLDAAYNFARYLSRDSDAAQDIVQDAFLRAYRNFDGYLGGDARAWIFAIVRNCYFAWQQERGRKRRFEAPLAENAHSDEAGAEASDIASEEDTPEDVLIRASESKRVRSIINALADDLREILVLRELEQLSYRQIADIIDVPIGTVMSRLARARREFGRCWRNENGDEEAAK
ncbi:sigma-70 family RNA polymerase sigma factor [Phyllobacterium sp. BT25]|uniref:RNA polymerase sigma factor n=1 Tax=Phyllobacterium pellucidum TaxID=2740464 RepID=A0A849VNE0_9HYPH|nr:sigma-70 family RNA polymerase sigma factor [Phyllobacterium pellucidum]NTS31418.1 sigma-70 family RNA polymerase sigma factor [Phyllobacterium pellucidum]